MQQIVMKNTRKIKQISVTNLFGMFNHSIPFNIEDKITIIHSPNGFGKTIILRLLNELFSYNDLATIFNQKNSILRTTPFSEFRVDFDDNYSFSMKKSSNHNRANSIAKNDEDPASHTITFSSTNHDETPFILVPKPLPPPFRVSLENLLESAVAEPEIRKIVSAGGLSFSIEDIVDEISNSQVMLGMQPIGAGEIGKMSNFMHRMTQPVKQEPAWLKEVRQSIIVRFIETQRLLNQEQARRDTRQSGMELTVKAYSEHLIEEIKTTLAKSTVLSQTLDRTFPNRVVSLTAQRAQSKRDEKEIRENLDELEKMRSYIMTTGLLDKDDKDAIHIEGQMDESVKDVLSIYVKDVKEKLEVFRNIADRIHLLTGIINKHFLYKTMKVTKGEGFVFETRGGATLPPTELSSGEQHELVLLYEMLFKVESGSLILIDEPELSLHVAWQREFLKDLQEITQLVNLDVLIATHSPAIIHDRWDLTVQLEGME